jgi:hypothetical protein
MSTEEPRQESAGETTSAPLPALVNAMAKLETQIGQVYIAFAASFTRTPDLYELWSTMALEEGGHAALLHALRKGFLSGVVHAKNVVLPLNTLSSLASRVALEHAHARTGVGLDQALRTTWELERSELDFLREMVIASSNLAELGFPTSTESNHDHLSRLRAAILQYATDEHLRREVKFLAAERSAH